MAQMTEKEIRDYLRSLSDETIMKYYSDVEWTPFPVLLIQEYQRRFKSKSKNEILDNLKTQAKFAHEKSLEMNKLARKKGVELSHIALQKGEEITDLAKKKGIELGTIAQKKGSVLGTHLEKTRDKVGKTVKSFTTSSLDNLQLIEKLAELKKAGVITDKEFREKKKTILDRI